SALVDGGAVAEGEDDTGAATGADVGPENLAQFAAGMAERGVVARQHAREIDLDGEFDVVRVDRGVGLAGRFGLLGGKGGDRGGRICHAGGGGGGGVGGLVRLGTDGRGKRFLTAHERLRRPRRRGGRGSGRCRLVRRGGVQRFDGRVRVVRCRGSRGVGGRGGRVPLGRPRLPAGHRRRAA